MSTVNEETADVMLPVISVCLKPYDDDDDDDDDALQSKNNSMFSNDKAG